MKMKESGRDAKAVMRGRKHSEATKDKLRKRVVSEETRKRLSVAASASCGHTVLGQTRTPEQRARMSAAAKMRQSSPHSEETKKKIGLGNKGKCKGRPGKRPSEKGLQNISESKKAYWVAWREKRDHGCK
jgi:hypothetical protein